MAPKRRATAKAPVVGRDAAVIEAQAIAGRGPEPPEAVGQAASAFPIVGLGASAGGLAAFEAFFSGMPADADPGMAFVLVQHLAPDHKSILTELVRRYTRMPVFEVEDGMAVRPNCAYIIPPNRDMAFLNGTLQLLEPSAPRGHRQPIDFFFRSLAQDQRERAICIVLSGSGSDGTQGVRAIKSEGGMAMAQIPTSTEFDSMPQSAIATGLVDYELPPAEMPAQLIAYAAHAFGKHSRSANHPPLSAENALKKVFILLRAQTGHDFSHYKPSTIHRRIERRLAVHQIGAIEEYVKYLQQTPPEVEALFRDLLIGVTSFFRDPAAFKALEKQIVRKLFAGKPAGAVVRVWSPACATGEEAYSIAILLQEQQEALKQSFKVQVFASDIDGQAIATARAGLYPASIAADITPERLARFFSAESDGTAYRIQKGIRDLLVFSEHDVIAAPPFSKLDLISCRNLLIYMGSDLQKQIVALFHYALNPGGLLFLGTSEGVGESGDLFATLDLKSKVYQRKESPHGAQRRALGRSLPPPTATDVALQPSAPFRQQVSAPANSPCLDPGALASETAGRAGRPVGGTAGMKKRPRRNTGLARPPRLIPAAAPVSGPATNDELQSTNEALESSNQEMQTGNEELQSTNEELETSKEELQSVNEELATVNTELQTKVTDLSRANNDMNNLIAGTGIATVFADQQLRILRFTPSATRIINLIPSDVGRPVGHIVSNLVGYNRLVEDTQAVLDTLVSKELDVQTLAGEWYSMRIRPYRTLDNVVEGAVITFVDITEIKRTQADLRKANDLLRLAVVVRDSHDAVVLQDMEGRILAWNPAAEKLYGWSESEAMEMNIRTLIPEGRREEALERIYQLSRKDVLEPYRTQRIVRDGTTIDVWLTSTALVNAAGHVYAIATTERPSRTDR